MPPKPTEPIDFPDVGEKLLDFLRALWTFICDVCILLGQQISLAFEAVWTYPPFEAFRNELVAALISLYEYAADHPVIAGTLFVLAFIVVPTALGALNVCVLRSLGYGRRQPVLLREHYRPTTGYGGTACSLRQSDGAKGTVRGFRTVDGAGSSTRA